MKTRGNSAVSTSQALVCMLLVSGLTLLSSVTLGDEASSDATHVSGSWQQHKYTFAYLGFTSTYSCDGLADQLKKLLLAAGARPDVKSEPGACASGFGRPDKFARADLTFYTLAPLAPLAPNANETPVEGVWRTVAFGIQSPRGLQIGDCELVEQFKYWVLTMFTTRNVAEQTTCVPYQESGSVINLKFESLVAAAPTGAAPAAAPAAEQGQIFIYPKNGQSDAQQAADRRECEQWARQQAGGAANASDYQRAFAACAEARGYTVK
jgi:hypothetical protein